MAGKTSVGQRWKHPETSCLTDRRQDTLKCHSQFLWKEVSPLLAVSGHGGEGQRSSADLVHVPQLSSPFTADSFSCSLSLEKLEAVTASRSTTGFEMPPRNTHSSMYVISPWMVLGANYRQRHHSGRPSSNHTPRSQQDEDVKGNTFPILHSRKQKLSFSVSQTTPSHFPISIKAVLNHLYALPCSLPTLSCPKFGQSAHIPL